MRLLAALPATLALLAGPALALSVPPVDLDAGQNSVAIGALCTFDRQVTERLTLGGMGAYYVAGGALAVRESYRFWRSEHWDVAETLSVGYTHLATPTTGAAGQDSFFVEPAITLAWRASPERAPTNIFFRLTVGPVLAYNTSGMTTGPNLLAPILPDFEVGARINPHWEIDTGLPEVIGVRYIW